MRQYLKLFCNLCVLLLVVSIVGSGSAAAAGPTTAGTVSQSYNADPSVLPDMIVQLKPKDPTVVVPLASKNIKNMFGVVVPTSDAAIVLTQQSASAQQVLVATSGNYNLLVSNEDGPIKTGDYLTISSLAGIGMKADVDQTEIIGQAVGDFNGSSNVIGSVSVKNNSGHNTTVSIGHIPANIRLAPNPLFQKNADSLPGLLTRVANDAASQPVKSARIGLSAAVLLVTFLTAAIIFYGGIHNGVLAIGRNPLAKKAISRGVAWAIFAGLVIFAAGIFAAYLILSL